MKAPDYISKHPFDPGCGGKTMKTRLALAILFLVPFAVCADEPAAPNLTPDAAVRKLEEGNKRFILDQSAPRPTFKALREFTAKGQKPFAAILTCADSRVGPETVFNQQIGDLFVCRVAGNISTEENVGSIEYAVEHLGVGLIVIMGHTECGAVKAALSKQKIEGPLGKLIDQVQVGEVPADKSALSVAVRNNVEAGITRLRKTSPTLNEIARQGRIVIVGAVYSLETGQVEWLPKKK
jgi:carbonic anhydrase